MQVEENQAVQDTEEETHFQEVEKLQAFGIGATEIKKLKEAGFYTVASVLQCTKKHLIQVKGLSEAKVDKILEASSKAQPSSWITGLDCAKHRESVARITTGCTALDELLGGGIESMSITEVSGEFRCGKTQLCHQLCVSAQLPPAIGGGNGKVAFIDTEGTFRPERIKPIAQRYNLDCEEVLENITYARAFNSEHQMRLLLEIGAKMVEEPYSMLIIDSVTALFRVDYSGRGELAERQQKLAQMLSRATKLAEEFNLAVFISNQVCSDPGAGMSFVADPKKPIGGHILAHASTTRLSLRKGRGDQRICKIYDSPCLPEAEAVFQLADCGIIDAKD